MNNIQVDVAIIGAGTAGMVAYKAARDAGASAVLIEEGDYGTTCARVGCMPSKLLIAAADAAQTARNASGFGVRVDGDVYIDGHAVMARVRRERDRFVEFVVRDVHLVPEENRLRGHARFVNDTTLAISDHTRVTTKSIVIATGSRAPTLDEYAELGDRLIISDDVFNWLDLPESVAVIGPGIIGLELGQALHRLGVLVEVFGRGGRVGPLSDPEIRAHALATFNEEFTLADDASLLAMRRDGNQVEIRYAGPGSTPRTGVFDYVLAAIGRRPNVDGLGLERTTLDLDDKGVPLFDSLTARASSTEGVSPIFIAGDAANFIPLLHEATDEGRIAGQNAARHALGEPVQSALRRAPLRIVFTDPQMAVVGPGFHAMNPGSFVSGRASFEDQGRARIMGKNKGLVNVYGDVSSGLFLGAEMLAPAAEHLAHLLAWALQNTMTIAEMLEMPLYHPVLEEGLRTALRDIDGK